jgi:hypothetical protein
LKNGVLIPVAGLSRLIWPVTRSPKRMRLPSGVTVNAAGKASADGESGCALAARALPDAVKRAKAAARTAGNDRRFILTPQTYRPQATLPARPSHGDA